VRGDRAGAVEDVALVRNVAAGSQEALATLYDRHAEAVYVAACRLTSDRQVAEEVVQETFLALWNRAELFDPNAGSLAAWLHTIARNRTVDRLRAIGRRPRLVPVSSIRQGDEADSSALERIAAGGFVVGGADIGPGPEGALDALEVRLTIRGALDGMPEVERAVILLAYRDNLTQAEIAQRLGWPLGTVKTRTRRALLRLRESLGGALGPDLAMTMAPLPLPVGDEAR
jgi:RNA polymerase sigma-70 factor (ECF subfamily)